MLAFLVFSTPLAAVSSEAVEPSVSGQPATEYLWYFGRDGCPACERAEVWLEEIETRYPALIVRRLDLERDPAARNRLVTMLRARGERPRAVPTFIYDDHVWVGFTPALGDTIEATLRGEKGVSDVRLDLGPFGSIELRGQPMFAATLLIAFVDGFNPCSLWVLTVLLAMILGSRSRPRIAAVGLTFLTVTAAVYGLFIIGLATVLAVIGHLNWIRPAVAILALLFGLVNIKDYFAFKVGVSFTIPEYFKPHIYRGGRALRQERSLPAALGLTVLMALGVAVVELPCTAGFPVIWSSLVSEAGIAGLAFAGLLAVYVLTYLAVEIAFLAGAVLSLRPSRLQERQARVLKLFGGMLMIALALVLLLDPALMESLTGSLLAVGGGLAAAGLVLLGHYWWSRPRSGS